MLGETQESQVRKSASTASGQDERFKPVDTKALEELITAAKALACDQNIDRMFGYFGKVVDMDSDINMKVERIRSLESELEKQNASHRAAQQQSLSTYTDSLDEIRAQLKTSQAHAATLQGDLTRREETITALRDDSASVTDKLQKSDQVSKDLEKNISNSTSKIKTLEESVEELRVKSESSSTVLKQQELQLAQLQAEIKRRQTEYDDLNKQYHKARQQLNDAQSLTVDLHSENPEPLVSKLDRCWGAVSRLVCYTFFKDMPDVILRNDAKWSRVKQPRYWDHQLPIPLSNSDAAKQMRSVVILASIVRTMDVYIFQPTPFLAPNSGARQVLTRQAREDSRKESAFRAMMQALLPREMDTAATSKVNQMCDEVMHDFGPLLSSELSKKFREELIDITEEASDIWRNIVLSRDAVQPSFAVQYYQDWNWQIFRFHDGEYKIEDAPHHTTSGLDEPALALFPRMYMYDEEGQDPLSHGVLFMKAETQLAKDEVEPNTSKSGFAGGGSALIKRQKGRTLSTEAKSNEKVTEARSFLDRRP